MRATDLPTCARLKFPKPAPMRVETVMQNIKDKLLVVTQEYRNKSCNENGWPESNLTTNEIKGLKEIKKKMNEKEIVVTKFDKSCELCVDSLQNYSDAVKVHTADDAGTKSNKLKMS